MKKIIFIIGVLSTICFAQTKNIDTTWYSHYEIPGVIVGCCCDSIGGWQVWNIYEVTNGKLTERYYYDGGDKEEEITEEQYNFAVNLGVRPILGWKEIMKGNGIKIQGTWDR